MSAELLLSRDVGESVRGQVPLGGLRAVRGHVYLGGGLDRVATEAMRVS